MSYTTIKALAVLMGMSPETASRRSNSMQVSVACRDHVSTFFSFLIVMQTTKQECRWYKSPCVRTASFDSPEKGAMIYAGSFAAAVELE